MKNCPKCNAQLQDHDLFCGECGAKLLSEPVAEIPAEEPAAKESVFCSQCGHSMDSDALFCPECGAAVSQDPPEVETVPVRKKKTGKILLISGIALLAASAIAVTVFLLFFGGNNTKYLAYIKDGEVWFSYFSGEPFEVTSKLLDTDSVSEEDLAYLNGQASAFSYGQVSADGKRIFFPDKVTDEGMNLYYQDLSDPDSAAVKISSDVTSYFINDKGDRICYNKNDSIYIGSVDQPQKVASEIGSIVAIDEKFQSVVYFVEEEIEKEDETHYEYTYYLWCDGEKEKLVSGEIESFFIMDKPADCRLNQLMNCLGMQFGPRRIIYQKLNKFCYVKEDVLNISEVDGQSEKIDSGVSYIVAAYPSGEIFYTKEDDPIKYVEYIQNADKLDLREDYENRELITPRSLWISDDGGKEQIAENYSNSYFASEKPVAILVSYDLTAIEKVEMSSEMSFYNTCSQIRDDMYKTKSISIVTDGVACETDLDDVHRYMIANDGSVAYVLCVGKEKVKAEDGEDADEETYKDEGDIYQIAIKEGSIKTPELYDSDVSRITTICMTEKNELIYFKDYNEEKQNATLIVDQEEIDFDVLPSSFRVLKNGGYVYYIDYNDDEKKQCGTLRVFQKGEAITVADDVYTFVVTPDNEILYLQEYDIEKSEGNLYRYNNGKNEKIDEDVTVLLDIYIYDKGLRPSYGSYW